MKLEVGKRYVLRNGKVTGALLRGVTYGKFVFDAYVPSVGTISWDADGMWLGTSGETKFDIIAKYIEPAPEPPVGSRYSTQYQAKVEDSQLRWQWGKPDRAGIWAFAGRDREQPQVDSKRTAMLFSEQAHEGFQPIWCCWIGDLPTILPPKRCVTMRLWLLPYARNAAIITDPAVEVHPQNLAPYAEQWLVEGTNPESSCWIRTSLTKVVEQ